MNMSKFSLFSGNQPVDMGRGGVLMVLISLSAPAMISMFFQNLYALADSVFVSWLGTTELAALSLCTPLLFIGMALSKGVAVGTTALMSHARGSGRADRTAQVAGALLPILVLVSGPRCLLAVPVINIMNFRRFGAYAAVLA
jgi:Na+-driven multidrug efflux pump